MIDIIYKTVKLSHLKKLQIIQNMKPNVSSHLHIFWLNFNKTNYSFLHLFLLFGKQIFERMVPGAMSISFCLERDDKNLGTSFEWGGAWVQMP